MFFQCPDSTKPDYLHPSRLFLHPIAKYLDEIFPDPEASIWSPDIPDIDQTEPCIKTVLCVIHVMVRLLLICHHFVYSLVYIISLLSKFSSGMKKKKKYLHRNLTTPFLTWLISWIPDRTVPRIKQNMVMWPDFWGVAWSGPRIPNGLGTHLSLILIISKKKQYDICIQSYQKIVFIFSSGLK